MSVLFCVYQLSILGGLGMPLFYPIIYVACVDGPVLDTQLRDLLIHAVFCSGKNRIDENCEFQNAANPPQNERSELTVEWGGVRSAECEERGV